MTGARFRVQFICKAACKDYESLEGPQRGLADKGIARLALRADEVGRPRPGRLAGCRELKFRAGGLRILYRIGEDGRVEIVQIVAIGNRGKGRAFDRAERRL